MHVDRVASIGGQGPIIHIEADLHETVAWADTEKLRWAFTLSNAGAVYFEDRSDLADLDDIDWAAVQATDWRSHKEGKQAEFLVESWFSWHLVTRIGVRSQRVKDQTLAAIAGSDHQPSVEIRRDWYHCG